MEMLNAANVSGPLCYSTVGYAVKSLFYVQGTCRRPMSGEDGSGFKASQGNPAKAFAACVFELQNLTRLCKSLKSGSSVKKSACMNMLCIIMI